MTLIALAGVLASGIYSCTKVSDTKDNEGIIEVAADGTTLFIKSSLVSSLSADLSYSEEELDILLHMKARRIPVAMFYPSRTEGGKMPPLGYWIHPGTKMNHRSKCHF